jgi:hypothetical protein
MAMIGNHYAKKAKDKAKPMKATSKELSSTQIRVDN